MSFIKLGICDELFNITGGNKINVEKLITIWDDRFIIHSSLIIEKYTLARIYCKGKKWIKTQISKEEFDLITHCIERDTYYFQGKIDKKKSLIRFNEVLNPTKTDRDYILESIKYHKENNIPFHISVDMIKEYNLESYISENNIPDFYKIKKQ